MADHSRERTLRTSKDPKSLPTVNEIRFGLAARLILCARITPFILHRSQVRAPLSPAAPPARRIPPRAETAFQGSEAIRARLLTRVLEPAWVRANLHGRVLGPGSKHKPPGPGLMDREFGLGEATEKSTRQDRIDEASNLPARSYRSPVMSPHPLPYPIDSVGSGLVPEDIHDESSDSASGQTMEILDPGALPRPRCSFTDMGGVLVLKEDGKSNHPHCAGSRPVADLAFVFTFLTLDGVATKGAQLSVLRALTMVALIGEGCAKGGRGSRSPRQAARSWARVSIHWNHAVAAG